MEGLQMGSVGEVGDLVVGLEVGLEVVAAVVKAGGTVGLTQVVPGTFHWSAESEQLSTWPFGERQSLAWELSQVPVK